MNLGRSKYSGIDRRARTNYSTREYRHDVCPSSCNKAYATPLGLDPSLLRTGAPHDYELVSFELHSSMCGHVIDVAVEDVACGRGV